MRKGTKGKDKKSVMHPDLDIMCSTRRRKEEEKGVVRDRVDRKECKIKVFCRRLLFSLVLLRVYLSLAGVGQRQAGKRLFNRRNWQTVYSLRQDC